MGRVGNTLEHHHRRVAEDHDEHPSRWSPTPTALLPWQAMSRIVSFAGSVRSGSLNTDLLTVAGDLAVAAGADVDHLDLGAYALPIYDGDFEATHGIPVAAVELTDRLAKADGILIASPEYNGGPSALLKNTIDWITRVDMVAFQNRPIGLLAATPGSKGGVHSLGILESILTWMKTDVHQPHFSLPKANDVIVDGVIADDERARLDAWIRDFVAVIDAQDVRR